MVGSLWVRRDRLNEIQMASRQPVKTGRQARSLPRALAAILREVYRPLILNQCDPWLHAQISGKLHKFGRPHL
ncbi:hypothetical protein RBWH47_04750 [Rhodopirellula baltica WH47]|uniref:Uncharacterized protein n=1 Tax=Rhodopirellula baltica WH47 TaxID=991778 RepID=F2ALU9_RHOBT|nr:hypothetical protein RBWH47_04750 [Rhodopirellula baltica WH47]